MLTRRIIACLDVQGGQVVKGVKFTDHVVVGDIVRLAQHYRDAGADELVFYDIAASAEGRSVDPTWVRETARGLDIPFCVAGGIRSVDDARRVLHAGADKISINTPALENPQLISDLARVFGTQCVVVGVDSNVVDGELFCWKYTGKTTTARPAHQRTLEWVSEAQDRGAGEVVLNCMGRDGTRSGYDIEQLWQVRQRLHIPLVASGGAGSVAHFVEVFRQAQVDAALAAGIFHRREVEIMDLKRRLRQAAIEVRDEL